MVNAPIALFVYNRFEHTRQTIKALQKNTLAKLSDLIIFSDAPKFESQCQSVLEVRNYIHQINGFKSLRIIEQPTNLGLANSIIGGVTKVCNEFGKVIVLEDDLVTSPNFLEYMNEALDFYEKSEDVVAIDAYMYPVNATLPETFFLKDPGCWGWATWHSGWQLFEADGSKLLNQLETKNLGESFDYDGSYPYTKMLQDQVKSKNNSWAIRWYASVFLAQKLVLHVGKSLVLNIGNDSSGTHGGETNSYNVAPQAKRVIIKEIDIVEHKVARNEIVEFFNVTKQSFLKIFFNRIHKLIKKLFE